MAWLGSKVWSTINDPHRATQMLSSGQSCPATWYETSSIDAMRSMPRCEESRTSWSEETIFRNFGIYVYTAIGCSHGKQQVVRDKEIQWVQSRYDNHVRQCRQLRSNLLAVKLVSFCWYSHKPALDIYHKLRSGGVVMWHERRSGGVGLSSHRVSDVGGASWDVAVLLCYHWIIL